MVARAGPCARLGADQPVRTGAGAEEAGALRRPVSGRSAREIRAPGVVARRDQYTRGVRRAQPRHPGEGAGRRSQAAPCRPDRRRRLAGALVSRPLAARGQQRAGPGQLVFEAGAGEKEVAGVVAGRSVAGRGQRSGSLPEVFRTRRCQARPALPFRARRGGRWRHARRAAALAQGARSRATELAGARPGRRKSGRVDSLLAESPAAQLRAGAGFCPGLRAGASGARGGSPGRHARALPDAYDRRAGDGAGFRRNGLAGASAHEPAPGRSWARAGDVARARGTEGSLRRTRRARLRRAGRRTPRARGPARIPGLADSGAGSRRGWRACLSRAGGWRRRGRHARVRRSGRSARTASSGRKAAGGIRPGRKGEAIAQATAGFAEAGSVVCRHRKRGAPALRYRRSGLGRGARRRTRKHSRQAGLRCAGREDRTRIVCRGDAAPATG